MRCLTSWLLDAFTGLRHTDGSSLVRLHGPRGTIDRGGPITFAMADAAGGWIDVNRVERLAAQDGISLRTGCFRNPGAGEAAHGLTREQLRPWFGRSTPVPVEDLREGLRVAHDRVPAAVRVSVSLATNFSDVYRLVGFLQHFLDAAVPAVEVPRVPFARSPEGASCPPGPTAA